MGQVVAKGKRHILVVADSDYRIIDRRWSGDHDAASFGRTDEEYTRARAVFSALEPAALTSPHDEPYHPRRRWARIGGLVALFVFLIGATVTAVDLILEGGPSGPSKEQGQSSVEQPNTNVQQPSSEIPVAVTNTQGGPIEGAYVFVVGTQNRAVTDSAGQAELQLMKPGIYQIAAVKDGYLKGTSEISISGATPAPTQIQISYLPPSGTFLYEVSPSEYDVLQIATSSPFTGQFFVYKYGCVLGWAASNSSPVLLDTRNETLTSPSGYTVYATLTGPRAINTGWTQSAVPATPPPTTC